MPSVQKFIFINGALLSLGMFLYWQNNPFGLLIVKLALFYVIRYTTRDKKLLGVENKKLNPYVTFFNIIKSIVIDFISLYFCYQLPTLDIFYETLWFFPKSFLFELWFDLGHYLTHRFAHNKIVYSIHKLHHKYTNNISSETTFYHSFLDLLLTNCIPFIMASHLAPMTKLQIILSLVYKTFLEISGHIGVDLKSFSFPQCAWLVKKLDIQLRAKDHYFHHTKHKYNFSKRFSIWDKAFGTYYTDEEDKSINWWGIRTSVALMGFGLATYKFFY